VSERLLRHSRASIKVLRVESLATVLETFGRGRGLALEGKDSALLLTIVIKQILRKLLLIFFL
jgi:hypothetical protein